MKKLKKLIKIPILTFLLSPKLFFLEVKRRIFGSKTRKIYTHDKNITILGIGI